MHAQGLNIMAFCKEYNAATQDKVGTVIPVEITCFEVGRQATSAAHPCCHGRRRRRRTCSMTI